VRVAFSITAFVIFCFLAVILLTLFLFWRRKERGTVLLSALNTILCIYFPIGTIVGWYYFKRVNAKPAIDPA
jgi:predicted transporter